MGIRSLDENILGQDVAPNVEVSLAGFRNMELDFAVRSDRGVVTLEGVSRVVADPLGQGFRHRGDQFVTGDGLDTIQGGTEFLEGAKIRLVEGDERDSHDQTVTGLLALFVGIGDSDEAGTGPLGVFDCESERGGEGCVLEGIECVHCGNILTEF